MKIEMKAINTIFFLLFFSYIKVSLSDAEIYHPHEQCVRSSTRDNSSLTSNLLELPNAKVPEGPVRLVLYQNYPSNQTSGLPRNIQYLSYHGKKTGTLIVPSLLTIWGLFGSINLITSFFTPPQQILMGISFLFTMIFPGFIGSKMAFNLRDKIELDKVSVTWNVRDIARRIDNGGYRLSTKNKSIAHAYFWKAFATLKNQLDGDVIVFKAVPGRPDNSTVYYIYLLDKHGYGYWLYAPERGSNNVILHCHYASQWLVLPEEAT